MVHWKKAVCLQSLSKLFYDFVIGKCQSSLINDMFSEVGGVGYLASPKNEFIYTVSKRGYKKVPVVPNYQNNSA